MKTCVAAACLFFVCGLACGQDLTVRASGPMPGGSFETFPAAFSSRIENGCWRWVMYYPRHCRYFVPELNRTFEYGVTEYCEVREEDRLVGGLIIREKVRRTIREGRHTEGGLDVKNSWVIPASSFNVILDETGPGVTYGTGIMGETEKSVVTEAGTVRFFKGFVVIDGKVYAPWCQILSDTAMPSYSEPAQELLPTQPVPQRRETPEYSPRVNPVPPLPLPSLPTPAASEEKEVKDDEEEERIPLHRAPIAMLPTAEIKR